MQMNKEINFYGSYASTLIFFLENFSKKETQNTKSPFLKIISENNATDREKIQRS